MDGWQGLCTRPLPHTKQTNPENYFDQIFSNFDPLYGNTGCRVFKRGRRGTKLEIFLPKNQRTQKSELGALLIEGIHPFRNQNKDRSVFVLNFENWCNTREWVSMVSYLMNFCEIIPGRGKNPGSR